MLNTIYEVGPCVRRPRHGKAFPRALFLRRTPACDFVLFLCYIVLYTPSYLDVSPYRLSIVTLLCRSIAFTAIKKFPNGTGMWRCHFIDVIVFKLFYVQKIFLNSWSWERRRRQGKDFPHFSCR